MKEVEYTIHCPAIPITHVFVEFQNTKIRDRYVRSASMQKIDINGRTIRISPVLNAEEKFHRKIMGFVKFAIVKNKGIALHHIKLNQEKKSITINGQISAMTDDNGMLKYNKYEDADEDVQDLMTKWLKKQLVATTVSNRERGMKRRNEELTTSNQEETTDKQKIKISFNSKDSKRYFFTKKEDCMTNKETRIAVADKKRKKKER